jgi:hypothetical protein
LKAVTVPFATILFDPSSALKPTDIVVLLTPAHYHARIALDPFECFDQALASHNYKIRHVPYTISNGIISTHAYFIKNAAAVIFITSVANCEPKVKVLAAEKPLMVLTWNMKDYFEPTIKSIRYRIP